MKLGFRMKSDTLICIWILLFRIGLFEVSTLRKCGFCLFSVGFTITDLQTTETVVMALLTPIIVVVNAD